MFASGEAKIVDEKTTYAIIISITNSIINSIISVTIISHLFTGNKQFISAGSCPSSHKYAYLGGKSCCRTMKENTTQQGQLCDGSKIGIDSICCENNDFVDCAHKKCENHEDAL